MLICDPYAVMTSTPFGEFEVLFTEDLVSCVQHKILAYSIWLGLDPEVTKLTHLKVLRQF